MRYAYPAKLEANPDGGISATFRDVPEAIVHGKNRGEALRLAADGLGGALLRLSSDGKELPQASAAVDNEYVVTLSTQDALQIAVLQAFAESGLTKAEFGRRMDRSDIEIYRILNPRHASKPATMEEALVVLGRRVVVEILNAS